MNIFTAEVRDNSGFIIAGVYTTEEKAKLTVEQATQTRRGQSWITRTRPQGRVFLCYEGNEPVHEKIIGRVREWKLED